VPVSPGLKRSVPLLNSWRVVDDSSMMPVEPGAPQYCAEAGNAVRTNSAAAARIKVVFGLNMPFLS
jgi:hypothetical protein